jgi:hypothetical protein
MRDESGPILAGFRNGVSHWTEGLLQRSKHWDSISIRHLKESNRGGN